MSTRVLIAGLALAACSATSAEPVQGRDYELVQAPQAAGPPGKIEVIEFFSYGCPHCAALHDRVTAWAAELPEDVVFRRVPVGFGRAAWLNLAKAYYALEATGDLAEVDAALYAAIHEQRLPLIDKQQIGAWLAARGVDSARFAAAFESFGVDASLARAEDLTRSYRVTAVPTFAVDGRYVVVPQDEAQTLETTSALIARARAEGDAAP